MTDDVTMPDLLDELQASIDRARGARPGSAAPAGRPRPGPREVIESGARAYRGDAWDMIRGYDAELGRLRGQVTAARQLAAEAIDERARAATGKGRYTAQEYVEMDGAAALAEQILAALDGSS